MPGNTNGASESCEEELKTLAALRAEHARLMDVLGSTNRDNRAEKLRTFTARAQKVGLFLTNDNERQLAQSILDYWSAELAACPNATANDFLPTVLDQPSETTDELVADVATEETAAIERKAEE